ncbi:stalk domain-containing protein [Paenibacillus sp. Y5S-9]|uniref:stalk domain-containing protein n=1 Tax=Paenibacillus sp. Y5S-9 TaxID=3122489 RepID=UPI0030D09550
MKKKVVSIVMASMLFAGAVSAASVWGTYKGNQIIRITSNGVALKTPDVPAISYNGRTMIPISMVGQLGVGYTWDSKNQTVDVTVGQTSGTSDSLPLKTYVATANNFKRLSDLGEALKTISNGYSLAYQSIGLNQNPTLTISNMNKRLNETINAYNSLQNDLKNNPIYNEVIINYFAAIDYFKLTDTALNKYFISNSSTDFKNYLTNSSKGFDSAHAGILISEQQYKSYIKMALYE